MSIHQPTVMELLGFGRKAESRHMRVGVIQADRQSEYDLELEEDTLQRLETLRPLDGGRVRISPYPHWDPVGKVPCLKLVRTGADSSEVFLVPCKNELYVRIQEIRREMELLPSAPKEAEGGRRPEERSEMPRRRLRRGGIRRTAGRLAVLTLLMLFVPFGLEGHYLTDHTDKASVPIGEVMAAATEQQGPVPPAVTVPAEPEVPVVPSAAEPVPYERMEPDEGGHDEAPAPAKPDAERWEIQEDQALFGLPRGQVALTFDDGPSLLTQRIVDTLTEHGVAATFLFVGKNAVQHPDAVLYAGQHGMAVGNHSMDHSQLTKAGSAEQSKNLTDASRVLESLTQVPVTLFRPPYGSLNEGLRAAAKEQHLKILMWNRDPEDWKARNADDIIRYFHETDPSGGVYVLHEDQHTLEALPAIVEFLKERQLEFTVFQ